MKKYILAILTTTAQISFAASSPAGASLANDWRNLATVLAEAVSPEGISDRGGRLFESLLEKLRTTQPDEALETTAESIARLGELVGRNWRYDYRVSNRFQLNPKFIREDLLNPSEDRRYDGFIFQDVWSGRKGGPAAREFRMVLNDIANMAHESDPTEKAENWATLAHMITKALSSDGQVDDASGRQFAVLYNEARPHAQSPIGRVIRTLTDIMYWNPDFREEFAVDPERSMIKGKIQVEDIKRWLDNPNDTRFRYDGKILYDVWQGITGGPETTAFKNVLNDIATGRTFDFSKAAFIAAPRVPSRETKPIWAAQPLLPSTPATSSAAPRVPSRGTKPTWAAQPLLPSIPTTLSAAPPRVNRLTKPISGGTLPPKTLHTIPSTHPIKRAPNAAVAQDWHDFATVLTEIISKNGLSEKGGRLFAALTNKTAHGYPDEAFSDAVLALDTMGVLGPNAHFYEQDRTFKNGSLEYVSIRLRIDPKLIQEDLLSPDRYRRYNGFILHDILTGKKGGPEAEEFRNVLRNIAREAPEPETHSTAAPPKINRGSKPR